MIDFDFLKDHGFGVVYGANAVKQKINELGCNDPRKGNDMNDDVAEVEVGSVPVVDVAPELVPAVETVEGDTSGEAAVFVQDEAFSEDEVVNAN